MKPEHQILLDYFKRERTYLRKMGVAFAERYPKISGRLELGLDKSPDPHIERLIESFALLTARIQYDIDSDFPKISSALLNNTYPQFLNPIPAMTMVHFEVDPVQGKLTGGHLIPKGTPLSAHSRQGPICRFMTCYPVVLWPVRVAKAGFTPVKRYDFPDGPDRAAMVLRLRVQTLAGPLAELKMDRLRFHLSGDHGLVYALHHMILAGNTRTAILPDQSQKPFFLPAGAIREVGFGPDEDVLPYPKNAHPGYRLLTELFTFPEKFMFFDLMLPENIPARQYFDLLFLLDQKPDEHLALEKQTFRLGCTPAINLFRKISEPIRVDERRTEYLLVPDKRREKTTEIHSILSVSGSPVPGETAREIAPFFSFNHQMEKRDQKVFYYASRRESDEAGLKGSRMYLSFVNLSFDPGRPPSNTVYAQILCTNRDLAAELPAGALMQIEQSAPLARIYALTKPTFQIEPPLMGATLWRLVSQLSLNFLSLGNTDQCLEALREILLLYGFSGQSPITKEIAGIKRMSCRPVVRRIGRDAWRGFCKGFEITLTFDEQMYTGSSAYLLAAVLSRFFPLYASINSFTQLNIKSLSREGIWHAFPEMAGEGMLF